MNAQCAQNIFSGEHSCETYAMNPESEFGHSYPEIRQSFEDWQTDEEIQVNWENYSKLVSISANWLIDSSLGRKATVSSNTFSKRIKKMFS